MASFEERLAQMRTPAGGAAPAVTEQDNSVQDRLAQMRGTQGGAATPSPTPAVSEDKDEDKGNFWDRVKGMFGNIFTKEDETEQPTTLQTTNKAESKDDEDVSKYVEDLSGKTTAATYDSREGVDDVDYGKLLVGVGRKGINQFAGTIASTADWLLGKPLAAACWENNPFSWLNQEMKNEAQMLSEIYDENANQSVPAQLFNKYGPSVVATLPDALMAIYSGGASAALSGASKSGGIINTVRNAMTTLIKNPQFWTSFARTAGPSYEEAVSEGASDIEASAAAVLTALNSGIIEVGGGGIQELPNEVRNNGTPGILAWVKSTLDEGKEEVVQGIMTRAVQNLVYRGGPVVSLEDENAVFNPKTMAEDAAGGLIVGGLVSGGQLAVNSAINAGRANTQTPTAPTAPIDAPAAPAPTAQINAMPAQGEISPSDGISTQPTTYTANAENAGRNDPGAPGFEATNVDGEQRGTDGESGIDVGVGGARAGTVGKETPFKTAPTEDAATQRSNWMSEELRKELAPGEHRVISNEDSLEYAKQYFAYDSETGDLLYEESIDSLLDVPNWTGVEADAAMLLIKEAEKRGDMDTVRALNRLRRATTSEGARTLQATKKWVSESGDNIVNEASKVVDAAVESGAIGGEKANETLAKVSKLAEEFDAVAKDDTPSAGEAPAEAVVKRARKTAAQKIAEDTPEEIKPKKKRSSNRRPKGKGGRQQLMEPFTFEYADAVGEAVAKGIAKKVEPVPEKTFLQQMTSVLRRFASEKLPKQKVESLTPIELMRDYIQNKEFYAKAWEMAQQSIRDGKSIDPALDAFINSGIAVDANADNMNTIFMRALVASAAEIGETKNQIAIQNALGIHGMDGLIANTLIHKTEAEGEMTQTIKDAASHYVNNVIAGSKIDVEKTINAKVKAALKDIKLTLSQLAVSNDTTKADIRAHVIKTLIRKYGFNGADAGDVADIVGNHYDALVKQAVDNKLEQMLKVAKPGKPKTYLEKIREAINVGGFDSDKFAAAFNEKFLGEGADMLNADMMREVFNATKAKQYADIIRRTAKMRHTTGLLSKDLSSNLDGALERIVKRGDIEFLRTLAANGIVNIATDAKKVTASEAVKTIRRQSMLSKAATTMRNFVSNGSFSGVDTFARDISVPLDFLLSKLTKTRSIAIDKNLLSKKAREGVLEAMDKSLLEVGLDVDASGERGAYEQTGNRTFKMSGGVFSRLMSSWEKWEGYALVTADAAAKGGTEAEIARGLRKLYTNGKLKIPAGVAPAEYIADMAKQEALYRTFQDDTKLSAAAMGLRDVANKAIHIGELGLGDVILPFAKTPANLATRAVEYSPAGLAKAIAYDIPSVLIKAKKGTLTAAEQARAVQNIGRGVTGSALIAGFAALSAKELIKTIGDGGDDDDKDKTAFEKMTGQYGTQWNLDATMRWFNGESTEWQDGDTLMSISFLEPFNAMMTTGALIVEDWQNEDLSGWEKMWESAKKSPEGAYRSISQLPMFSSFRDFAQNMEYSDAETGVGRFADAAAQYGANQISSFIPNALKGIAQGIDPIQRNTYAGDNLWEQTLSNVMSGIPGLRSKVEAKTDSFGNEMRNEGGVLNFLNSNILPGYITHYNEQTGSALLDSVYELTGNASIYPDRKAPSSISGTDAKGNEFKFSLDSEAGQKYLATAGAEHEAFLKAAENNAEFSKLSTEEQAAVLTALRSQAHAEAKYEAIADSGHKVELSEVEKLKASLPAGALVDYLIAKEKAVIPNNYTSNPTWQKFEMAAAMPESFALDMIIAQGGDTGRRIAAAVDSGVDLDKAIAYYRATTERNDKGENPSKAEENQRIAALGLTAEERGALIRAFNLEFD